MAAPPKTPEKKGKTPTKHARPELMEGFSGHGDVNDFVRGAIWCLGQLDWSQRDIAAATGTSQPAVNSVLQECREHKWLRTPQSDNDRERSLPATVVKRRKLVKKYHALDQQLTSPEIARRLFDEKGIEASPRTIQRDQVANGGRHLVHLKVPLLTDDQKKTRLEVCRLWLKTYPEGHDFWTSIVFSDETKKGASDMDQSSWVYDGEDRGVVEKSRWTTRIHVWGFIGPNGIRHLQLLPPGTVDQVVYRDVLKETIGKAHWGDKYWWQQDGAPAHSAQSVVKWLASKKFKCLWRHNPKPEGVWPPNSPDLSPIENLWSRMWYEVARLHPVSAEEQLSACKRVFYQWPRDYLDTLLGSFRERVLLCVKMKGESINSVF